MDKKATGGILVAAAQFVPLTAFAVTNVCDIFDIVQRVQNWFAAFFFAIAAIMILYAGFLFLTGGGNEDTLKKAKTYLIYGLIGIAIGLLAGNAVRVVQSIVGGTSTLGCQR